MGGYTCWKWGFKIESWATCPGGQLNVSLQPGWGCVTVSPPPVNRPVLRCCSLSAHVNHLIYHSSSLLHCWRCSLSQASNSNSSCYWLGTVCTCVFILVVEIFLLTCNIRHLNCESFRVSEASCWYSGCYCTHPVFSTCASHECCLKKHCRLTAVRNSLRSQTPPTHFTLSYIVFELFRSVIAGLALLYAPSRLV